MKDFENNIDKTVLDKMKESFEHYKVRNENIQE